MEGKNFSTAKSGTTWAYNPSRFITPLAEKARAKSGLSSKPGPAPCELEKD